MSSITLINHGKHSDGLMLHCALHVGLAVIFKVLEKNFERENYFSESFVT